MSPTMVIVAVFQPSDPPKTIGTVVGKGGKLTEVIGGLVYEIDISISRAGIYVKIVEGNTVSEGLVVSWPQVRILFCCVIH